MEYRISFSKRAVDYPTTKVALNGRDPEVQVWCPRGRWDTSCKMTFVPKSMTDSLDAESVPRPKGFDRKTITLEKRRRTLQFAKVWYELRDEMGRSIRWQGVVAAFQVFPDDSKELRDTIFLGLHECIEYVDPRVRMKERCVEIDPDGNMLFPGTVKPRP